MKTSKFFFAAMMVAAVAVGFTACEPKGNEPDDPFNPGNGGDNGGNDSTVVVGERDGSEAKPYIVQDLLDMKTNGTLPNKDAGTAKYWVEAYIVGSYDYNNGDPQWVIGAGNTVTTNVLLADDAASTDTYAVATVKLGDYASVLNLVDNPANLGKKLKLYGVVEKYCGVGGVINLEKVYMDGAVVELPGLDDVEVNDNMKPSEAAAAAAQLKAGATSSKDATVIGYVSKIATEYSEQHDNITIYMSDAKDTQETFYCYRIKGGKDLTVGTKIAATGKLMNYKGNSPQMAQGGTYVVK